jgi:hypothetical protein
LGTSQSEATSIGLRIQKEEALLQEEALREQIRQQEEDRKRQELAIQRIPVIWQQDDLKAGRDWSGHDSDSIPTSNPMRGEWT